MFNTTDDQVRIRNQHSSCYSSRSKRNVWARNLHNTDTGQDPDRLLDHRYGTTMHNLPTAAMTIFS